MKIEFEFKEGSTKIFEDMANVTEEMIDKVNDRKAQVFGKIGADLITKDGYHTVHAMRDLQEAFPPGELDTSILTVMICMQVITQKLERFTELIGKAKELFEQEK